MAENRLLNPLNILLGCGLLVVVGMVLVAIIVG